MLNYKRFLEENKTFLITRLKDLESKKLTHSIEGMIIQTKSQLNGIKDFLNREDSFSPQSEKVISFLLKRNYDFRFHSYSNFDCPELIKKFFYKQVRICINKSGIMILLDLGAGLQLYKNKSSINPYAKRIDYHQFNDKMPIKSIELFEERADNKQIDDNYLESLYKKGYNSKSVYHSKNRNDIDIEQIVRFAINHSYNETQKEFKISSKTLSKHLKTHFKNYYKPIDYSKMTSETFEHWFQLFYKSFTDFNFEKGTIKQMKRVIELKAIRDVSKIKQTYHYKAIDKLFKLKKID